MPTFLCCQVGVVLVELLKGTGFPTEANAGRGLRWRIRMKDLHGRGFVETSPVPLDWLDCRTWIEDARAKVQIRIQQREAALMQLKHPWPTIRAGIKTL